MRTIIITILLTLSFCSKSLIAQGSLYPMENYVGGGIGYSPMFITLDSIPGASLLKKAGLDPKNFSSPFIVQGGEAFTHIAGRWRIGGYAGIGAMRISTVPEVMLYVNRDTEDGYQKPSGVSTNTQDTSIVYLGEFSPTIESKFSFALGAVSVEYVLPVFRDVEIATGAMFGLGTINLSLDQHSGTARWGGVFDNLYGEFIDSTLYYQVDSVGAFGNIQTGGLVSDPLASQFTTIGGTFFNFQPYIAIKWQIMDRMGLRISMGFNKGTIGAGKWYLNDRVPISDSPESVFQGIAIRTMLYFGL
mgnify:CR=1 FL=1